MGVGRTGVRAVHLLPEPGHQRVVAEPGGVHGGALRGHLPPDAGARRLHGQPRQAHHHGRVAVRAGVLLAVAGADRDQAAAVPRTAGGALLRLQATAQGVPRLLLRRPHGLLPGAAAPLLHPLQPDRARALRPPRPRGLRRRRRRRRSPQDQTQQQRQRRRRQLHGQQRQSSGKPILALNSFSAVVFLLN